MNEPSEDIARTARLRILHTTDLHMCLIPFDYVSNRSGGNYSLARIAPEIAARKSGDIATLLFDTGDIFQGNSLGDFAMRQADAAETHPMVAAMNGLGYDAITLGNHDFDYGLDRLNQALGDLDCATVLTNIDGADGAPFVRQTVLERQLKCGDGTMRTIKIGLLGLLTTDTDFVPSDRLRVREIIAAAQDQIPKLRENGADLIVALCHCGIAGPGDSNIAAELAAKADVDVILTGHVHDVFPSDQIAPQDGIDPQAGTLHGKPATMAGAYGTHLGQIDLELRHTADGWRTQSHVVSAIAAEDTPERPDAAAVAVAQAASDMHQRTRSHIATPLGRTPRRINSYFAQITADTSLRILADIKMALAKDAIAGTAAADLPLVAAVAPFRAGGHSGPNHFVDIAVGSLSLRDVSALYPFENQLTVAIVTGAHIRAILEQSSAVFHQLAPGDQNQPLIRKDIPAYRALTVFGLTYTIDLSHPPGPERITQLCLNSTPLQNTDRLALSATAFAMAGSTHRPGIPHQEIVYQSDAPLHDLIADQIRASKTVLLSDAPVWNFAAMPGTTATFQSSPAARTLAADVPHRVIMPGGLRSDGFCDFTLSL